MKNLTRLSRYTLLSAAPIFLLFLMSFSCQDHEVPPQNPMSPVIVTLDAIAAAGRNVTFKTQFTTLGNIQVSEYGVVFLLKADFEPGSVPTPVAETHDRGIINKPASLNEETVMKKINGTPGTAVTYRAYAKLANGTTIYGAVKEVLLVM